MLPVLDKLNHRLCCSCCCTLLPIHKTKGAHTASSYTPTNFCWSVVHNSIRFRAGLEILRHVTCSVPLLSTCKRTFHIYSHNYHVLSSAAAVIMTIFSSQTSIFTLTAVVGSTVLRRPFPPAFKTQSLRYWQLILCCGIGVSTVQRLRATLRS